MLQSEFDSDRNIRDIPGAMIIKLVFLLCLGCQLLPASESARILGLFPFPGKSHLNVYSALTKELAKRGHEVTVVVSLPMGGSSKNHKEILIDLSYEKKMANMSVSLADFGNMKQYEMALMMFTMTQGICDDFLDEVKVKELINSNEKYDLILSSTFFLDCIAGFKHKFKIPVVQVNTFHGMNWHWYQLGNPIEYASYPDAFKSYSNEMKFGERVDNFLNGVMWMALREFYHVPAIDKQMKRAFGPDTPSLRELESQASLLLLNTDIAFSHPRALTPNIINVGGMHVKPPKPLPQDLKKWLDESKNGVIYFSMGSNMKSKDLSPELREVIIKVFKGLKENVLWKWEEDVLPGKPENVRISKWLPQNDLLAHPNIKIFITHGGLLSTQEATYHGVPLVGIPIFGDQSVNMQKVSQAGNGVMVTFTNLTEESLSWGINTILTDPSYRRTARRNADIFRDQPQSPLDRAVFWTEYVIRHKGAPHLRPASANLYWWQRELLDVLLFLLLVASMPFVLTIIILKTTCYKGNKKQPSTSKSTSSKSKKHN